VLPRGSKEAVLVESGVNNSKKEGENIAVFPSVGRIFCENTRLQAILLKRRQTQLQDKDNISYICIAKTRIYLLTGNNELQQTVR
jgi:hypothetical protein